MNIYDIFKSDSGYRVCLATWGEAPVLENCPWYETEAEAEASANYFKFRDSTIGIGVVKCSPTRWIACLGNAKFIDYPTETEAQTAVIAALRRQGFTISDILKYGNRILEG